MSYCRWSTDDFRCDLYVYGDVTGGVTIHVASFRYAIPADAYPAPIDFDDGNAWYERHKAIQALLDKAERVAIGLPYDGQSFYNLSYQEAANKVRELIAMGYQCDPTVADEIEADGMSATT